VPDAIVEQIKAIAPHKVSMIEIDGSIGEAGGQVLRTALSVSCVLQQPVKIINIRKGRDVPGLRPQHLTVCKLLSKITRAKVKGAEIGSKQIEFEPGEIKGGNYSFDIGTAGSCTLLMQSVLPVLLFAKQKSILKIIGGTHVRGAPSFEYFSNVFLPAAAKFGAKCSVKMERPGFYPKGGGKVVLNAEPSILKPVKFEEKEQKGFKYLIISSGIPAHVAQREEKKLKQMMWQHEVSGEIVGKASLSPGNCITLWGNFIGASSLGERGKPAEKVANEACREFLGEIEAGTAVDFHLADQLLLYAAFAKGKTEYLTSNFSNHLKTNAQVLRKMTQKNINLVNDRQVQVE